jgi:hypothetical protein
VTLEVGVAAVLADLDVAEEAELLPPGGLLVDPRDRLDLRMVGRDAGADEPERGRQAIEHVDLDRELLGGQQMPGGVEAGRPGADDGDSQRVVERSQGHAARDDSSAHGPVEVVPRR